MEFIIKHHFPNLALDIVSLQRTCDSLSSPTPPRDQNAIVPESIELSVNAQVSDSPDIGDEDCTIDRVDGTTVHYSGEFSHWNFSMHIKRNIDELMAKANVQNSENVTRVPDFIRVGEADPASTSISDILAVVPPRPVATFLTNVFFNHATSVYYYVDRRWFDDILDRIYTNPVSLRSKDVTAICVVLMVLAVGTQYVHLESPDRHKTCSTGVATDSEVQSSWELEIGSGFYRQVAKLLSEVIHAGSLLSVQVLLLLGLYSLPIDASGLSYIYLNLAIKVAIQNGMHRKVSRNVLDARTKEIRRRIWWTVYCMERQAEAFLHEISCLRTCANTEVGVILNRIKCMKADLQGPWSPPRGSALLPTANHQAELPKSRALIHSRLECCLLHMFIGRPFILAHRQARTSVHSKDPNAASPEVRRRKASESHSQWDFLVQDCVAAAKEVISACQIIQTGDMGLAKSSYAEYSSCRASLLVLIAYSICYRTNEFANTLQIGLQAIREMASAGDSARSEVSLLETLEAALHRLHVFNPLPSRRAVTEANDSAEEGYNGLLNWYKKAERTTNPRFGPLASEHANVQAATAQDPRMTPNGADATVDSMPSYVSLDGYPFDFDLLNSDGSVAFFTSDFDDHGNTEREFFESLSWLPK
ncbi:hypothetical protein J4E91_010739 [Alternaria rosae]|nr:hypothetical protein J4E91_010739 [Alternaria rosae]